jgi:hypothetical protein
MSDNLRRVRTEGIRIRCACGALMPQMRGGDWGGWECPQCDAQWCQDCGAEIDQSVGECAAYIQARRETTEEDEAPCPGT